MPPDPPTDARWVDSLLPLSLSQPGLALTTATDVLAGQPDDYDSSVAHQVVTIVERDRGNTAEALHHGRAAVRAAHRVGAGREADVLATFGATLVYAGHTGLGLRHLAEAVRLTPASGLGRVLHRRAYVLWLLARYEGALEDLDRSIEVSAGLGDRLWVGRSLVLRSDVLRALGRANAAESDAGDAERLLLDIGEVAEAALALHNRASARWASGDLVGALALMDAAAGQYGAVGLDPPELVLDSAQLLLSAGLVAEAQAVVDAGLGRPSMPEVTRAELILVTARSEWASGKPAAARARADEARELFTRQRRPRWAIQAWSLSLQSRWAVIHTSATTSTPSTPTPIAPLRRDVARLVARIRVQAPDNLPDALMLAAQIDRFRGRSAEEALREVAATRRTGPPLRRATGWLASAQLAQERGNRRALLQACRRGLDAVDEHRALLGDIELRSLASQYGLELAELAVGEAAVGGTARDLLGWAERWRATALAAVVRPPRDAELEQDVAALRDVSHRLGLADDPVLVRDRGRLEQAVRRRYRHLRGLGLVEQGIDVPALLHAVEQDTVTLVSLVVVGGDLHAVTVAAGRVTRTRLGTVSAARDEAGYARFTLRRAAFGRRVNLPATGVRLQQALLGDSVERWHRPRVVVVPPAELLTVPFGLLPVFADTVLTVAPSATLWLRTREQGQYARGDGPGAVALVCGPGLRAGEDEVRALRSVHPDARILMGRDATVDAALDVMDGTRLAHVVAHGSFRADAPLFSSLALDDGPLTVHDFDRLTTAPESVVLSACELGSSGAVGAYEALGLVSNLLASGSRSVMASVVPVNDYATVPVVSSTHTVVAQGGSLAEGLLAARRSATDPVVAATAASFTVWGI